MAQLSNKVVAASCFGDVLLQRMISLFLTKSGQMLNQNYGRSLSINTKMLFKV